jgi:CRP/FNR family transcriptional regulator
MNNLRTIHSPLPAPLFRDCPDCCFTSWSQRARLSANEFRSFDDQIEHQRLKKKHEFVHRAGTALVSLYVINSGFLKASINDNNGHEQITGFFMPGDLVGMEAIATGKHQCNTTALEDSSLCGIVFASLEQLNREIPSLQHDFNRTLGAEINRDHGMMLLLGAMCAEERVAMFLLNLSRRFAIRGRSSTCFHLPMTRQEIGNYLGLTLETVSRTFSHLGALGLIVTRGKDIEIRDTARLQEFVQH